MIAMKWKQMILSLLSAATMPVATEVQTYQGSTRWNTTFFRANTNTSAGTTSYTTYYLVESFSGYITDQVKVDAWSATNPATGRVEKYYYVDRNFAIEFGYFGRFGTDVGGGMQFDGIEAISPFRGTYSSGALRVHSVSLIGLLSFAEWSRCDANQRIRAVEHILQWQCFSKYGIGCGAFFIGSERFF